MHGAAAVGTPAVVLWSEFIAPNVTGYRQHPQHPACPSHLRHARQLSLCRKSMEAITVREVADALTEILSDEAKNWAGGSLTTTTPAGMDAQPQGLPRAQRPPELPGQEAAGSAGCRSPTPHGG